MSSPDSPSETVSTGKAETLSRMQQRLRWLTWGLTVLVVLFVAHLVYSHIEIGGLRAEIAKRLQSGDDVSMEAKTIAKTTQDMMVDIQTKVVALENRQAETQNQQVSLSQMYQDLSKSRDDWSLAEIEQVLSTANQQLQLSKNIDGALVALQNADRTLAHSNKPQFIAIRGAIARDIGRLRAVPNVDTAGMALKLDSIISEISRLPLMAGEKPLPDHDRDASSRMKKELEFSLSPSDWAHSSAVLWNDWIDDMRGEIHSLVRVQEVDAPDALILSPSQAYYLRENLKLRLLSARLSLLSHSPNSFKNDINAALDLLDRYFDTSADSVKPVRTTLRNLESSDLSVDIPSLSDSLNAVQNHRMKN